VVLSTHRESALTHHHETKVARFTVGCMHPYTVNKETLRYGLHVISEGFPEVVSQDTTARLAQALRPSPHLWSQCGRQLGEYRSARTIWMIATGDT